MVSILFFFSSKGLEGKRDESNGLCEPQCAMQSAQVIVDWDAGRSIDFGCIEVLLRLSGLILTPSVDHPLVLERRVNHMRKSKGRRKVGRKKRRMRAKIRHRK
jgi:hypothetical protein